MKYLIENFRPVSSVSTPQSSMTYSAAGARLPGSARGLQSVQPRQSVAHHTEGHLSPASPPTVTARERNCPGGLSHLAPQGS